MKAKTTKAKLYISIKANGNKLQYLKR